VEENQFCECDILPHESQKNVKRRFRNMISARDGMKISNANG